MERRSGKRGKMEETNLEPGEAESDANVSEVASGCPASPASPASAEALMNHVVLKQIFECLDAKNLLRFSLVNKVWCSTARRILRLKRRCVASIPGLHPCQELLRLNKTLSRSVDPPFSGLAIRTCPPPKKIPGREESVYIGNDYAQEYLSSSSDEEEEGGREEGIVSSDDSFHPDSEDSEEVDEDEYFSSEESSTSSEFDENVGGAQQLGHKCVKGDLSKRYSSLLGGLNYRHLEIHWDRNSHCPAEWLISKIFREKGEMLSELKITRFPFSVPVLGTYLGVERKDWLPNLKVLDLGSCVPNMEKSAKYDLIDAAPQLQKQLGLSRYHDLEYFLNHGRVSVMKHYDCFYPSNITSTHAQHVENEVLMRFVNCGPKLTKFLFTGLFMLEESENGTIKFIRDFLSILFDSVSLSLEEMQMDQIHFILFLFLNSLTQPLVELKKLSLGLSNNLDRRMGFPTLERFDWGRWFPCLKTVHFCISPHNEDHLVIEELRRRQQPTSFSCLSVTQVVFVQRFYQADYTTVFNFETLGYLSTVFPKVREVSFMGITRMDKVLKFLWVTWPLLESITMSLVKVSAVAHNLDSIFCGIAKEQASFYESKSVSDLKAVEFQPEQPSILSLSRLKKFRVELIHRQRCHRMRTKDSHRFFLTHVTPTLVFARLPELIVEVFTDVCQRKSVPCGYTFSHLKPFVNVADAKEKHQRPYLTRQARLLLG